MSRNRRNYYRLLHLQPDAPAEVIKSCYRTLMSTMRRHPDLGGDHETAALINEAYAVLSDPARRAAYDEERAARAARGTPRAERRASSKAAPARDPSQPANASARASSSDDLTPRCPFCRHPAVKRLAKEARCERCQAPLRPVAVHGESDRPGDRRGVPRVSKADWAVLHLKARDEGLDVRLRDLSPDGISVYCGRVVAIGQRVRIVSTMLDVVADVVACRRAGTVFTVHAALVTACYPQDTGIFVSATA